MAKTSAEEDALPKKESEGPEVDCVACARAERIQLLLVLL
jgi:hypothetical protein